VNQSGLPQTGGGEVAGSAIKQTTYVFYARYGPESLDGGVFQTDDFGQEGGVSKNHVFARTSLMDDTELHY